jgi:hypothetical protein
MFSSHVTSSQKLSPSIHPGYLPVIRCGEGIPGENEGIPGENEGIPGGNEGLRGN